MVISTLYSIAKRHSLHKIIFLTSMALESLCFYFSIVGRNIKLYIVRLDCICLLVVDTFPAYNTQLIKLQVNP